MVHFERRYNTACIIANPRRAKSRPIDIILLFLLHFILMVIIVIQLALHNINF